MPIEVLMNKNIDRIVQLVPAFHFGDAIGESIRNFRNWVVRHSIESPVYSLQIDPELNHEAFLYPQNRPKTTQNSIIILHYALPSILNQLYRELPGTKIILYHNITPPHYFMPWNPELALLTQMGREELKTLKDVTDLGLADSEFNRKELEEYGYRKTRVCPIWIPLELYEHKCNKLLARAISDKITLLFVGRVVPNKKIEDVIKIVYWYRENMNPNARLIIVGKYNSVPRYYYWLREYGKALHFSEEELYFTGHVSYEDLVTYYQNSSAFISMSEHEGFCVPLIESMYFNLPVIAYASTAVPEIMDTAGILVHTKQFEYVAELLHLVLTDQSLRQKIIAQQQQRLSAFSHEHMEQLWNDILS
jgi:L-malate glycosyltransferase